MYYNHNLRANLQEWKNQLYKSDFSDFKDDFRFFFEKLNQEACLKSILIDIETQYPLTSDELDGWTEQINYNKIKFENQKHRQSYNLHLCQFFYDKGDSPAYYGIFGGSPEEELRDFLNRIVTPLADYLHSKLDDINNLLYILEKYKLRTEWFTKDVLKEKYRNVQNNQYEQVLDDDLRLFLFDQGIEYPFSSPKSASGRADIVSLVNTEDPLILEIKVYDSSKGYKKDRIIKGFNQIVNYANDYHKAVGYLVIFNLDNIEIEIENIEADIKWPNRLIFNGKTYYIIIVNMNYDVSASKQGTLEHLKINVNELTNVNV